MFDISALDKVRIGVLGDLALDIHWYADMTKSELSRETPHYPLPVYKEEVTPGAAGNVAANLAALDLKTVSVCGVLGDDWRGDLMKKTFDGLNIDRTWLITEPGRVTNTYCKPMRCGISDTVYEDPRIDFCAKNKLEAGSEEKIISFLKYAETELDALCVCDQFQNGVLTDRVTAAVNKLSIPVFVDSRDRVYRFHSEKMTVKPNEVECSKSLLALGVTDELTDEEKAVKLAALTKTSVLMTLGEKGSVLADKNGIICVTPAVKVSGPVDICGAGDTSLSAFSAFLTAGASISEAAIFASLASAVTVKKIGVTGTASREEILNLYNEI